MFVFWKVVSRKSFFKLSCVYLPLEKLGQRKTLSSQRKIWFGFQKIIYEMLIIIILIFSSFIFFYFLDLISIILIIIYFI